MLLQIAETLPREMQGILACCNPIPPLVRSNLLELHHIILRAKEQSLEKVTNELSIKYISKQDIVKYLFDRMDIWNIIYSLSI